MIASREGRLIARAAWPVGVYVFAQVPSEVPLDIVPKMSSLPPQVKAAILAVGTPPKYSNQLAMVYPDNQIMGYIPTAWDQGAHDWTVVPVLECPDFTAAPVAETAGTAKILQ